MHPRRVERQRVEQGLAGLGVVALGVAGGDEALVAPEHLDRAPVHGVAPGGGRHLAQHRDPDPAAGEHHRRGAPGRLRRGERGEQAVGGVGGRRVGVGVDDDLGGAHASAFAAVGEPLDRPRAVGIASMASA